MYKCPETNTYKNISRSELIINVCVVNMVCLTLCMTQYDQVVSVYEQSV